MIPDIKYDRRYQRSEEVLFREIDGEIIIVPVNSKMISAKEDALFTLTDTGRLIWNQLDGTNTVQQLIDNLCQEYDAPQEQVSKDVVTFLEQLAVRGMIKNISSQ